MRSCVDFSAVLVVLGVLCGAACGVPVNKTSSSNNSIGQFVWLSDLHIDPYYGTAHAYGACKTPSSAPEWGSFGCDAPWHLVEATIKQAKVSLCCLHNEMKNAQKKGLQSIFFHSSI